MYRFCVALIAVLVLGMPAHAADRLGQGIKVGDRIPASFAATDQAGKQRDFPSLGGKRGLILLFTRSLDW